MVTAKPPMPERKTRGPWGRGRPSEPRGESQGAQNTQENREGQDGQSGWTPQKARCPAGWACWAKGLVEESWTHRTWDEVSEATPFPGLGAF